MDHNIAKNKEELDKLLSKSGEWKRLVFSDNDYEKTTLPAGFDGTKLVPMSETVVKAAEIEARDSLKAGIEESHKAFMDGDL
jgi:hypothetical protein